MIVRYKLIPLLILAFIISISACKKEEFTTDGSAKLNFSDERIVFDTVFVSLGSTTRNFRVYNNNNQPIRTNIRLAGPNTNFRMNVNGLPGRSFNDVEIRANDSLWVFVEVTVDPNAATLPYIITDSIVFETNVNQQDVKLAAWGQNAHFIIADHFIEGLPPYALLDTNLHATILWDSILPYVVYGGFAVVDSTQTLTIDKGTKIHFSNGAGLWVYKGGTLKVNGTKEQPVVFEGLRRESSFADEPGQWDRIWINDGGLNEINYAIIKNGFIGLQTETLFEPQMAESLVVNNTIIKNMAGIGLFARNFTINGYNNVVANCGLYCSAFLLGGSYDFTHCTFANYWKLNQRSTPVMYMNNYAGTTTVTTGNANFNNCIIYGNNDNELEVDIKDTFNFHFNNCLFKMDTAITDIVHYKNIHRNIDPGFKDTDLNNYNITTDNNFGDGIFVVGGINFDITGITIRSTNTPDVGAYEK